MFQPAWHPLLVVSRDRTRRQPSSWRSRSSLRLGASGQS